MRSLKQWKRKERVCWAEREEREGERCSYDSCKIGKAQGDED